MLLTCAAKSACRCVVFVASSCSLRFYATLGAIYLQLLLGELVLLASLGLYTRPLLES